MGVEVRGGRGGVCVCDHEATGKKHTQIALTVPKMLQLLSVRHHCQGSFAAHWDNKTTSYNKETCNSYKNKF